MGSPIVVPTPSPAPAGSKLNSILLIINSALAGLSMIPILSLPIQLEQVFQRLLVNSLSLYHAETGQPFDLTKISMEDPVP
jgi:hypothetical protein